MKSCVSVPKEQPEDGFHSMPHLIILNAVPLGVLNPLVQRPYSAPAVLFFLASKALL